MSATEKRPLKAKYRIVSRVLNKDNGYTPIHVVRVVRSETRKKNPHAILTVSINLFHGIVEVDAGPDNSLTIRPSSASHISITKP